MAAAAEGRLGKEAAAVLVRDLRQVFSTGRTREYEWRVAQLRSLLVLLEECESQIYDALRSDLGKPEFEAFVSEISLTRSSCRLALKKLKTWMKPEKASDSLTSKPAKVQIVSEPFGVVLIISAWNYPLILSLDPLVGAIAAGNAVVIKPSEISPATSSLISRLLPQYLDRTAIQVVEGSVSETTLLLEQRWDKIFYTGNGKVGRIVMAAAAKHLTPVLLELGGKSPVVVDSNIDLNVAVKRIIAGKWGCNNGQACIAPDYIITTKEFAPELVDSVRKILKIFFGEDPLDSKDLSRIVNSNHYKRLVRLIDDDKVSDKIVIGGERNEEGLNIAPTILLDVPLDSLIMNEEIFGPLLPIITVEKLEESFDIIKSKSKPLAAYLFTTNKELEQKFVESISAGGILINDTSIHLATHTLPFGGVGESGMGCYHGKFSFEAFSHKKAVMSRSLAMDISVRYPPFTTEKKIILRPLLNGDKIGLVFAMIVVLWRRFLGHLGWPRT